MRTRPVLAALAAVVLAAGTAPISEGAGGFVINVQLAKFGATAYSGLAVAPDSAGNTNWNLLAGSHETYPGSQTIANLSDSIGTNQTGVSITLNQGTSGSEGYDFSTIYGTNALLQGYYYWKDAGSVAPLIVLSNVPASYTYDLYVYGTKVDMNPQPPTTLDGGGFVVGSQTNLTSGTYTNGDPFAGSYQGAVWNVFHGLTPVANQLTVTLDTTAPMLNGYNVVNGVQLVALPAAIADAYSIWASNYFGCIDCPQAAPDTDPFGKGLSNTNQFLAGLDPTNSASRLAIVAQVRQGSDLNVFWRTAGVRTNILQATAGTGTGSYTNDFVDVTSSQTIIPIVGDTETNYVDAGAATNGPARW